MKKTAFTLIELLVTIILFSLLLATSLYSFRFLSINIKNINNTNPKKAINYSLLRESINSIYPYVEKDSNRDDFYCYFKGDNKKIRFTTISPLFYREIALAQLSIEDNKLIYKEGEIFSKKVDYSNLDTISLTHKLVILDNISSVKFIYYINGKKELYIKNKIPNLIQIKFIYNGQQREYLFSIKSDFQGRLNMVETQYKDF